MAAASKRAADAQGALAVASARLDDVQKKGTASAGQLAAAQEAVNKASRNVELQTTNLVRAEAAEKAAKDLVTSATKSAKDAQDSHTASIQANNKETEKAPGLIEKFSSGWIKTAAVLGTVTYAAYGIKQAFGALYSTIDVASSLNEEINKSQVVFGDASKSVIDFTQNAARGMGQSRLEALQSTGTFGNLFRAVGLSADASANMSTHLVQLAADLASFNNADPSDVLLAMRAGLVGESEPLRRFGVDVSDLALRQEALNLGIYDGTGVLNQAQKAQAAYSLLLKQTSLAQGDFQRTSAGLANSTRILSGEWTDLKGAIGGLLLGPATGIVHWLNDLLPRMSSGVEGLHQFTQAFTDGFRNANSAVSGTGIGGVFQTIGAQVRDTTDFLRGLVNEITGAFRSGLQDAGPLLAGLSGSFSALLPAISNVSSSWHGLIQNVVQGFLPVIRDLVPVVAQLASSIAEILGSALQGVIPILTVVAGAAGQVAQIFAEVLVKVLDQVSQILPGLTDTLSQTAGVLGQALLSAVQALSPILPTLAQAFGDVATVLSGAFLQVVQALEPLLPVLADAFGQIAQTVAGALTDAVKAIAPILPDLAQAFADIATAVGGALADAVAAIAPVLPPLVDAFVQLLQAAVQPLLPLLPTLARILVDIVNAVTPLVPVAAGVVGTLAQLATAVLPALNPLLSAASTVVGFLASAFQALPGPLQLVVGAFVVLKATLGVNIFSKVVEGIGGLSSTVTGTVPRITGAFSGMTSAVKGELSSMTAAFATAKAAQRELVASNFGIGTEAIPKAVGDLKGLQGAASDVASKGFGALKNAGSGLVNFFGGPWGIALAGVTIAITGVLDAMRQATEQGKQWAAALRDGGQAAQEAKTEIDQASKNVAGLATGWGAVKFAFNEVFNPTANLSIDAQSKALEANTQAQKEWKDNASLVELAQLKVTQATDALNDAIKTYGANSPEAITAGRNLRTAQDELAGSQRDVENATRSATQSLQDQIDTQIGATNAQLGYQSSLLNTTSAIDKYNQGVADGTLKESDRAQAENSLAQSILSTVEASGRAAAQALGPNADASAKSLAATNAEKAAFEQLVGQLGFIPPSLQSVASSLGVTDAALQTHQGNVDPVAQAYGDLALSTIQGTFLPIFGAIPGTLQTTSDALNTQATGALPTSQAGWATYAQNVLGTVLGIFGANGAVPGAIGNIESILAGLNPALAASQQAWHDFLNGVKTDANSTFGGGGQAVPDVIDHANVALNSQVAPGGPVASNGAGWQSFLDELQGRASNTFGSPSGIPGALNTTNQALDGQAAPGGPIAANGAGWRSLFDLVTGGITGLMGPGGTVPSSLDNSNQAFQNFGGNLHAHTAAYVQDLGTQNQATIGMQNQTSSSLGIINAAFANVAAVAQANMQAIEGHIYGPMTTALASFAATGVTHTNTVDVAFVGMRDIADARMGDVEGHIYGPMTASLATFSNNAATMSGSVQNSFAAMANGAIGWSNTAAAGINAAWNQIRAGVAGPVNFVVVNAIGGALIPAFNNVASAIGIKGIGVGLPTVKLADGGPVPGYADGGPIGGAYIGPKVDNVPGVIAFGNGGAAPVRLNPREYIQPVSSVDKYGLGFMEAVRTGAFPTAIARAFADGGQVPGFAQGGQTYPTLEAWVRANLPGAIITSAYRPGANDYHGAGDAVDISYPGNPQSRNMPAAAKIAATFGGITELIHNPNESIKNGRVVPPSFWGAATWAEHANHVHWAMTPQALASKGVPVGGGPVGVQIGNTLVTSASQVKDMLYAAVNGPLGQLTGSFGKNQLTGFLVDFTHNLTDQAFARLSGPVTAAIAASASAAATGVSGPVKDAVAAVFGTRGWGSGGQWNAVDQIVSHESGWNPGAQNPVSTASGLFQEIDATWRAYRRKSAAGYAKMRLAPINEQAWGGLNYIANRYGSPAAAWSYWQGHHYYDDGGILGDGMSGSNASGFDERVLSPRQTVAFERLVNVLDRGNPAAVGGPSHLTGDLYLDSGEFMGKVRGVVVAEMVATDALDARNLRSA